MGQPRSVENNQQSRAVKGFFLLVGAAAALVHFLSLLCAVQCFGIPPAWGNVLAFGIAFCVSFSGHYVLTFRDSSRTFSGSLWRWFFTSMAGFLLNQQMFVLGLGWFGRQYYPLVWLVVTVLVTIVTFLAGRFWAFAAR